MGVSRAKVGTGACVGSDVGFGVADGIAAFVKAYWVITRGKAVFCISATLKVGVGAGPQAASERMMSRVILNRLFLIIFSPYRTFLPQRPVLRKIEPKISSDKETLEHKLFIDAKP
jgi:hypothetical protein